MSTFSERLLERMAPWNIEQTGPEPLLTSPKLETSPHLLTSGGSTTDLARYLRAIAAMFEPVLELAEEGGYDGIAGYVPPYGRVFNPQTTPQDAIAYLSQYVGQPIPAGASEAEARALLLNPAGMERGTLKVLESAIKRVMGTAPFTIQERTAEGGGAEAYHFNVLVGIGKSSQALYNAINEVKPAGLWYSVIEVSGAWVSGTKKWSEVAVGKKWSAIVESEY